MRRAPTSVADGADEVLLGRRGLPVVWQEAEGASARGIGRNQAQHPVDLVPA